MSNKNTSNAFGRSTRTPRSPVDHSKSFNCRGCKRPDSHEDMVECTKCRKWFHFSCAEVDEKVKSIDWQCKVCVASKVAETKSDKSTGVKPKTRVNKAIPVSNKLNLSLVDQGFGFVQTPTPVESAPSSNGMPNVATLVTTSTVEQISFTNTANSQTNTQTPLTDAENPPLSLPVTGSSSSEIPSSNLENANVNIGTLTSVGIETKMRDDKSIASSKSSQRKKQLAMMKLQEEFELRAQREREFLDQKYTLLEESEEKDDLEEVDKSMYTNLWVKNQVEVSATADGENFNSIDNNIQGLAIPKSNLNLAVRSIVTPSSTVTSIPHSKTVEVQIASTNKQKGSVLGPIIEDVIESPDIPDYGIRVPTVSLPQVNSNVLLSYVRAKNKDVSVASNGRDAVQNQRSFYGFPMCSANQIDPLSTFSANEINTTQVAYPVSNMTSRPICSPKAGVYTSASNPWIQKSLTQCKFNETQPVPNQSEVTVTGHQTYNHQGSSNMQHSRSHDLFGETVLVNSTANSPARQSNSSIVSSSGPTLINHTLSHHDSHQYSPFILSSEPTLKNTTTSYYDSQFNSSIGPAYMSHTSNQYNHHFNRSLASGNIFVNPTSSHYNPSGYQQTSDGQAPTSLASNFNPLRGAANTSDGNLFGTVSTSENVLDGNGTPTITRAQLAARQVIKKDLPFFYGDPEEWPMFLSRFKSSTKMCGYSDDENLIRLQDCLKDRAKTAVRGRLLHAANVPAIINTLKVMFGRPELIINACIARIEKTSPLKQDDIESLISFAFSVEELCSMIVECECPAYLSDRTLLQKVTDKLPTQVKLNWAMYRASIPNADLATLGNWLNDIAQAASQIVIPEVRQRPSKQEKRQQEDKGSAGNGNYIATHIERSELKKSTPTSADKPVKFCKVCNKNNHSITECRTFQGYQQKEKWATIRKLKLCRNCLGSHSWNSCKRKQQCGKDGCTSLHHPLLHSQILSSEENGNKKNEVVKKDDTESSVVKIETCQNNAHTSKQPVIFRIIPVIIYGDKKLVRTFAYLDEGSSFTLMEDGIVKELGLKGTPRTICLEWTSKIVRTEPDSQSVTVTISGNMTDGDKRQYKLLDVRTVPTLNLPTQTISHEAMSKRYPHLNKVEFESYEESQPRILIGLPHAKLTNTLKTIEGNWNEPIAVSTMYHCRIIMRWRLRD